MTQEECRKLILKIVADIAPDEDLSKIKPDVRLRDQLALDSMDFLDIVMELRKRCGIEVPEADYIHLASLDSCAEYLMPKFNAVGATVGTAPERPPVCMAGCDSPSSSLSPPPGN